jgi:hypothetical protein
MSWCERPQHFPSLPSADRFTDPFYSLWAFHANCGIESPFSRKWLNWSASEASTNSGYKTSTNGSSHSYSCAGSYPSSPEYRRKWTAATFQRNNWL